MYALVEMFIGLFDNYFPFHPHFHFCLGPGLLAGYVVCCHGNCVFTLTLLMTRTSMSKVIFNYSECKPSKYNCDNSTVREARGASS